MEPGSRNALQQRQQQQQQQQQRQRARQASATRLVGHLACVVEVLLSTAVHCAYAAFIVLCAVLADTLALASRGSSASAKRAASIALAASAASLARAWPLRALRWPVTGGEERAAASVAAAAAACEDEGERAEGGDHDAAEWMSGGGVGAMGLGLVRLLFRRFRQLAGRRMAALTMSMQSTDIPATRGELLQQQQQHREKRQGRLRRSQQQQQQQGQQGTGVSWRHEGEMQEDGHGDGVVEELGDEHEHEHEQEQEQEQEEAVAPIVLLHGIFGFGHGKLGSLSYFGGVEFDHDAVLVPDLGSLTSVHDRARKLFYYLKGGVVDYGAEHSAASGHHRFGICEEGRYREWDERHPVHFVGHSSGVQVARMLQHMLANGEFEGYESNADWVASITSLSGALNGTTRVYIDGLSVQDGRTMVAVSLLQVLRVGVLLYEWLDLRWLKSYYCFGFAHFPLSWRHAGLRGLWDMLVADRCGPFATGDWILPDLSIQRSAYLNSLMATHPNTFYFSYATVKTRRVMGVEVPSDVRSVHPLFVLRCCQMGLWTCPPDAPKPYPGFKDEEWQANDGALNTVSMLYPRVPTPHPHAPMPPSAAPLPPPLSPSASLPLATTASPPHMPLSSTLAPWTLAAKPSPSHHAAPVQRHLEPVPATASPLQPGIWYYTVIEADHIQFIISRQRAGVHFDVLYESIFHRCRSMRHLAHHPGSASTSALASSSSLKLHHHHSDLLLLQSADSDSSSSSSSSSGNGSTSRLRRVSKSSSGSSSGGGSSRRCSSVREDRRPEEEVELPQAAAEERRGHLERSDSGGCSGSGGECEVKGGNTAGVGTCFWRDNGAAAEEEAATSVGAGVGRDLCAHLSSAPADVQVDRVPTARSPAAPVAAEQCAAGSTAAAETTSSLSGTILRSARARAPEPVTGSTRSAVRSSRSSGSHSAGGAGCDCSHGLGGNAGRYGGIRSRRSGGGSSRSSRIFRLDDDDDIEGDSDS